MFGRLFDHDGKVIPSVLLPATFGTFGATRFFLSVADE
jgi:hypothetical protein